MNTCSESFQRAIQSLTEYVESNRERWNLIFCDHFCALSIVGSPLVEQYVELSKQSSFWDNSLMSREDRVEDHILERHDMFYDLHHLRLSDNAYFNKYFQDEILDQQTVIGNIPGRNTTSHTLRTLVAVTPQSRATKLAVSYLLDNWYNPQVFNVSEEIAVGILALQELDFHTYKSILEDMCSELVGMQGSDGSFPRSDNWDKLDFRATCYAIIALARMHGFEDIVDKAVYYIKDALEREGGTSKNAFLASSEASLGIRALDVAGEGPKTPKAWVEWERTLATQQFRSCQPWFIHTSPIYGKSIHVKQIHDKIIEMMNSAQHNIRIISLYVDMLYEKIIEVAGQGTVSVQVLARPKAGVRGARSKIIKNVIDLIKVATKGNIRENPTVHARMVIIDDTEALISSADFTRDQLYDEYNAGIWTKSPEVVKQAIAFFDNVWDESTPVP